MFKESIVSRTFLKSANTINDVIEYHLSNKNRTLLIGMLIQDSVLKPFFKSSFFFKRVFVKTLKIREPLMENLLKSPRNV